MQSDIASSSVYVNMVNMANLISYNQNDELWILDLGATNHIFLKNWLIWK